MLEHKRSAPDGDDGEQATLDLLASGKLEIEGRLVDASNATLYCTIPGTIPTPTRTRTPTPTPTPGPRPGPGGSGGAGKPPQEAGGVKGGIVPQPAESLASISRSRGSARCGISRPARWPAARSRPT